MESLGGRAKLESGKLIAVTLVQTYDEGLGWRGERFERYSGDVLIIDWALGGTL